MAAGAIVVTKSFDYRGAAEEWSNKYHFQGSAPSTETAWRALADAFIALEADILTDQVTIVSVLCYHDSALPADYLYNLADFGGVVTGGYDTSLNVANRNPGDVAYVARWNTGKRSTKGKPIYLFKYYHGGLNGGSGVGRDVVDSTLRAGVESFANQVRSSSGAWPGLADKAGDQPIGYLAETYLTTRTLKRRGRRPT